MIAWLGKVARSFVCAFQGLRFLVREERNMRLHLLAAALAFAAGFALRVSAMEWCLIILCIGAVLCAEALNSAIEHLCDRVTQEQEDAIRDIKDASASGVLCVSVASAIVGAVIFLPRLWAMMGG
jgi:diacylglycerol kinase